MSMKGRRSVASFVVVCTISVYLLRQYWGNFLNTKPLAITNPTTVKINKDRDLKLIDEFKINTSSSGDVTNFIYLTQTESCLAPHLLRPDVFGVGRKNDVLVLSWKQPCVQESLAHLKHIKYIYNANSTWSTGRNILYRLAKETPKNYLYYVFLDDDMTFDFTNSDFRKRYRDLGFNSPLQAFEDFLLKHEPAIAVPIYCPSRGRSWACDKMLNMKPMPEYLPVTIYFDAAFTAFHRNAVDLMLPYRLDYEQQSWWQSQKFVILAADLTFRGQVLRFAPLIAYNTKHRKYPRWDSDNWTDMYNILKNEMPEYFRNQVDWKWKPNYDNIDAVAVVQNDTVITPMWRMKIPVGKMTVEPYKHLKTS